MTQDDVNNQKHAVTASDIRAPCLVRRSLLMPSLFFAVLYWREMRLAHRIGCMALLTVGICLGVGIVGRDLDVLLHQLRTAGVELRSARCCALTLLLSD